MLVKGTYDDAFELCLEVADKYGWYNRNTAYNPYMTEGKRRSAMNLRATRLASAGRDFRQRWRRLHHRRRA